VTELRIGLVPLARVNFDVELAQQVTASFRSQLIMRGLKVAGDGALVTDLAGVGRAVQQLSREEFDLLLVFQATFTDSTMVVALAEAIDHLLFLWAIPEQATGERLRLSSLCGANLAAHALGLRARAYEYTYARPNDPAAFERLRAITAAAQVSRRLRQARVGLVGEAPAGMDTCRLDEETVISRLGVEVVRVDLQEVFAQVRQVAPEAVGAIRGRLEPRVSKLGQVDAPALQRSLAAYAVLREIASQDKLDGLAIRCWPEFFTDLQCSACGPISMLSDEQIPSSCEADINGTISQLVLQWLSGEPAFSTDIVSADFEADTIILWHCGQAPLSMANPQWPPEATIHSNRKLPLLMQFPLKPGRITLARFSQAHGVFRLVIGSGEVLPAPRSFTGTSGVVRCETPASKVLDTLLGEGLEHHLSLTYGDHITSLCSLAKMLNIPVLKL
jgi:L-fucose isomerase-like protein